MSTLNKILFAVASILILVSGIFMVKTRNREREHLQMNLRADSIAAQNDTLKQFQTMDRAVLKQLGDSLQIVTRQIAQGIPGRGVASGTVSARGSVSGTVNKLDEIQLVPLEEESHKFEFVQRRVPYSLAVQGVILKDSVQVHTQVEIDPVNLRVDLMCRPRLEGGIRKADAFVTGPQWLTITQVEMVQRPEICNAPALKKGKPWYRPQVVAGLGYSWLQDHSGPAAFVGVGFGFHIF